MITGIYNLPAEVCNAASNALSRFVCESEEVQQKAYMYEIENVFSFISLDSKIMILKGEESHFGDTLKYTCVGNRGSVVAQGVTIVAFDLSTIIGGIIVQLVAQRDAPNILQINVRRTM